LSASSQSLQRLAGLVDETYVKIKKAWTDLYRAVDSQGNTIEFFLSPTRDAEAAKRFFCKALHVTPSSTPQACLVQEQVAQPTVSVHFTLPAPRVITVDKNAAYPKAITDLKACGLLPNSVELRQVKYLNNVIEQDHRFIKRLTKPGMGFFSFETAWRTLQGFEVMNIIRKRQVQGVGKGDVRGGRSHSLLICLEWQPKLSRRRRNPILQSFHSSFCNTTLHRASWSGDYSAG
jgi:transposase-like protein